MRDPRHNDGIGLGGAFLVIALLMAWVIINLLFGVHL